MLESLRVLISLQDLDTQLNLLKEKKIHLPMMIEKVKESYEKALLEVEKAKKTNEEAGKKRKDIEIHLDEEEARLRKLKGRTSEIKTNKEYQTLLSEIESANQEKNKDEDVLLVLMEEQEGIKQNLADKEKVLAEEKKIFEDKKKRLEDEVTQAEEDLGRLEKERVSLIEQVPSDLKQQYQKVKSLRKDFAVVSIHNGTCLGCHIQVLPQMVAELKKQDKVLSCLNCHRILYWKE